MRAQIAAMLIVLSAAGARPLLAQEPGRVLAHSGEDETWISRTEDGRRATLRMSGEVRVSEAGDRILFIAPGGFFTMIEETPDGTRRLDARPAGEGAVEVSWRVDGAERPAGAEAGTWLARMLEEFDALREDRRRRVADVRRLEDGRARVQSALREVERTRSAQVQRALREVERTRSVQVQRALRELERVRSGEVERTLVQMERLRSEELQPALRAAERVRVEAVKEALRAAEGVRVDQIRAAERAMRAAEQARTRAVQQVERALREAEVVRDRRLEELMRHLEELRLHLRSDDGRRIWIL